MNGKLVSLKTIVEKVYRDYGFNYSLDFADAAEWAGDLLALLKAPLSLETKIEYIDVCDHKGKLPCDLESIIACAFVANSDREILPNSVYVFQGEGSYLANTRIIDPVNREAVIRLSYNYNDLACNWDRSCLIPMRYSTDSFENKYHANTWDYNCRRSDYTYKVNANYIFPNFKIGKIAMCYLAIPLDEEGYPMIPAEQKWREAITTEIAWKIALRLRIQENISRETYSIIENERNWAVGRAETQDFNIDQLESIKNSMLRLIPKPFEHQNFFRNLQVPEQRYNHPLYYGR